VRLPVDLTRDVDVWATENNASSRSEAIRQLVELGLSASHSSRPHSPKTRAKAAALAAEAIDRHIDQSAPPEEQASRKRRLLKGPKEFRDIRKDHR
jgi:metal-responsive CopG/Arc/MetJ family transcriptional regulator